MSYIRDKKLSKALAWILRHGAVNEGLAISKDGFVKVSDILNHRSFCNNYDLEDIQRVVTENEKKRFTLTTDHDSGQLLIKANQGHSLQIVKDCNLIPIIHASDAPVVIHGTYLRHWEKIKFEGLSRMNRIHIHFSPGELGAAHVMSGMRATCQVYIYIDMKKALADGITFFKSINNVILSPGNSKGYIEPKYFSQAIQLSPRTMLPLD